jgi:CDP-diacylglycerol--glycerol-3-phosphate 3-phosphatidyltransferase
MSLMALKHAAETLLRPVSNGLVRAGVRPNGVTAGTLLGSLAIGAALYFRPSSASLIAVPLWAVVRLALNVVDGMMAREHDLRTREGALLNELGDFVGDLALGLSFTGIDGVDPRAVVAFVSAAAVAEHAGLAALLVSDQRRYDGPLAKPDRLAALGILAIALAAGARPGRWTTWTFAALALASLATAVRRADRARRG